MTDLGTHVLLDLEGCPEDLLRDDARIRSGLRKAALEAGATIVGEAFHTFNPPGVSGVILIAESHLSVHVWPEYDYVAIDFFSCGEEVIPQAAIDVLEARLKPARQDIRRIDRGQAVDQAGRRVHTAPFER